MASSHRRVAILAMGLALAAFGGLAGTAGGAQWTLTVQSSPIPGVGITGSSPGTTNYSSLVDDGSLVILAAPAFVEVGGVGHAFLCWQLDGVSQPAQPGTLSFTMSADHTAVAAYQADTVLNPWAWGYNSYGQLGDNSTTTRREPVQVHNITSVVGVAGGRYHSLAVKADGTLWAWGSNTSGQLGDNSTTRRLEPVQVHDLTGVCGVAAGYFHSLALASGPQPLTISGSVTAAGGAAIPGVTLGGLPGDPVTQADGSYAATVDYAWSGTVTPAKADYTFSPASKAYTNVTSNQADDYTGTHAPVITSIEPSSGPAGSRIAIAGSGFGATRGTSQVVFGPAQTPDTSSSTSWSVELIICYVPTALAPGPNDVRVVVNDVQSNAVPFEVVVPTDACVDDDNTSGLENGTPEHPFRSIQKGVNAVADDGVVKVAQGTYTSTAANVVSVQNKTVYLRGGYVGGTDYPNPGDFADATRDWDAHPTVIDGQDTRQCIWFRLADGELSGFTVTRGYSGGWGGGMYNDSSSPTVTHVAFSGNQAWEAGGMLNINSSNPTLTHVTFTGNQSDGHGGGMWNQSSNPTLTHVAFSGNQATYGGGMRNDFGSSPTLTDVTFNSNQATYTGGMDNTSSSPTLTHVTFSGNRGGGAGGMFNNMSDPTLSHVTFSGNQGGLRGGGMANYSSSPTLTHVTFSGNRAATSGGAMDNYAASSPVLVNCILWGNEAPTGPEIHNDGTSCATVTYSDVQGGYAGTGNFDADPLFADPGHWDGDTWVDGDYHLKSRGGRYDPASSSWVVDAVHSPCIDTGDPDSPVGDEPAPNGGRVNMGAYGATDQASKSIPPSLSPPGALPLGPITQSGLQANWASGGNPTGTLYLAECWEGNGFEGVGTEMADSGYIADLMSCNFTGLALDTQYSFRARAKAAPPGTEETGWTDLGAAYTLAAAPGVAPVALTGPTSMTANWTPNGNPAGTQYFAECYLGADFSGPKAGDSGWLTDTEFEFTGLTPNACYSLRVKARNGDLVETAWTELTSDGAYTRAATPGALAADMQVMAGGRLNLDGPAPKSLGVLSIAPNGNPADTLFAIKVGTDPASGWLQFVDSGAPWNRIDLYPTGTAPEWHTAAEWADKRLRGLAVDTAYAFSAKAQNAVGEETALAGVGSYATNMHCDVNRSGAATVLDLVLARDAALAGGTVGTVASWACDVNDDGCVDVSDLSALRSRILNP